MNEAVFEVPVVAAEEEETPYSLEAAGRNTRTKAGSVFNAGAGVSFPNGHSVS